MSLSSLLSTLSNDSVFGEGAVESWEGCDPLGETAEDCSECVVGFSMTVGTVLGPVAGGFVVGGGAVTGATGFLEDSGLAMVEWSWGGAVFG
ncbi:MAG: hypothetical protein KIT39_19835 [Nitrospirales bacterium]|nr:hypothetical protein [Nitrospirales bacterium]